MSIILVNEEDEDIPFIFLKKADFPDYYINFLHPNDHEIMNNPILAETIFHRKKNHNRLLLRISIKVCESYIPATFICDTGAPSDIYLSAELYQIIKSRFVHDIYQNEFLKIGNDHAVVGNTPDNHPNINIIGLRFLDKFGLIVRDGMFGFDNIPEHF